jgi:predicted RNA-binding Zn-ribbon protein involved in translation (DUF1610 family)
VVPKDRNTIAEPTITEETTTTEETITINSPAKCPKCGSQKICRTHREGQRDRIIALLNIYPYYCRDYSCRSRFYRFGRKI